MLTKTIDKVATDTLGTRMRTAGSTKNNFEDTGDFQHLHKICSVLLNCVLAAPNTTPDCIPKAFHKLTKLRDTPYKTPLLEGPFPLEDDFGNQLALVFDACKVSLKMANKALKKAQQAHTQSFINRRVNEIRELRNSPKPSQFFKRCHPLKAYPNQSLYTAKETTNTRGIISTHEYAKPQDVLRIVAKCWEGIMSSKKRAPSCFEATPNYLIDNKGLKAAKAKILGKDGALLVKVQPEEIEHGLT